MRIAHIVAGAGGMYCGSCLHGNSLANAMRAAGQDVVLVPAYTPLRTDENDASLNRVVLGGVNVYLQHRWAFFRKVPWFFDRILDHPGLLRWFGKRGTSTKPEKLGSLTLSMIQGEEGRQRRELLKLARWLKRDIRPRLVHLSNVMLVGTARLLAEELDVPVVSTLNGEDAFIERLAEPHYTMVRDELRKRCGDLHSFMAMSRYSADFMAEYLDVSRDKIHVVRPGLNLQGHGDARRAEQSDASLRKTVTVGFLSRICPEKGLHRLAEAFAQLAGEKNLPPLHLRAAGFLRPGDRPYLDGIVAGLKNKGIAQQFEYMGELDRAGKIRFLQSLDAMCLPSLRAESKSLAVLEAWANGVPVVLPDHGPFPEMVEDTRGGLLYEADNPASLAARLKQMILEPAAAARYGRQAQEVVRQRYNAPLMAEKIAAWYKEVLAGCEC
ncbi:MAG: glycosyltransferase family 4 protein [Planctomycetota bacterium]|nr:glycosyltransferase family 4 protein [Planctomycetota bacterium]